MEEGQKEHYQCGWGSFRPSWCQQFRNPKLLLFVLCWASLVQGMVVNGFASVSISSIEKQQDLNSKEGALINSCYHIGSTLCLIPVTYFGGRGSKPRYIAVGMLIMAIGSFVFILPHYITGLYVVDSSMDDWCFLSAQNATNCNKISSSNNKLFHYAGQLLLGAGASPLFTLGSTFLNENVPKRSSSFYLGIYYSMMFLGTAIGHLTSSIFLAIPVDIDKDGYDSQLTDDNPRFIGAWWIGFLITGVMAFAVSIPMGGFPVSFSGDLACTRGKENEVHDRKTDVQQGESEKSYGKKTFENVVISFLDLLKNPTFVFLNMSGVCEFFLVGAFATFGPKYLEFQFKLTASDAALYSGIVIVGAASLGTCLGGFFVKQFDIEIKTILKCCFFTMTLTVLLSTSFLVSCKEEHFAGVNFHYVGDTSAKTETIMNLTAECNSRCYCSEEVYNPVCGNGVLYFSPCHAGCMSAIQDGNHVKYENCTCIGSANPNASVLHEATTGKCDWNCSEKMNSFLPLFTVLVLLMFLTAMPALTATLRCLPQTERTFGLGVQWILAKCLGSIIGPVVMGDIFDMSCLLFEKKCDQDGACSIYDNLSLSRNIFTMAFIVKGLSALFIFLSLYTYQNPSSNSEEEKDNILLLPINGALSTCRNEEDNGSHVNASINSKDSDEDGSVSESGGSSSEMETVHDEQYFRKLQQEQFKEMKDMMKDEVNYHEEQIKMHKEAIGRHKKKIHSLDKKDGDSTD